MMRKLFPHMLALLLVFGALAAHAQTPTDASIRQLLEITDAKALMLSTQEVKDQMMEQIKLQLHTLYPEATPEQSAVIDQMMLEMMNLLSKEFSWDALEQSVMGLYRKFYTQAEVNAMISFYSSPEGQGIVKKMPQLTREVVIMMQQRMMTVMPEMQRILTNAMTRLQAIQ